MEMRLERQPSTDAGTLGRLFVAECFTLEDVVREGEKIAHESAIPAGRYRVSITMSARFGRMMPVLHDVPGFTGVRIHSGNTQDDTSGCLLVGRAVEGEALSESRLALEALQPKIADALARGEDVWLEVRNAPAVQELSA